MSIRSQSFHYKDDGILHCEDVSMEKLVQELPVSECATKTPIYVYSKRQILNNIISYKEAFAGRKHIIGFSVKANMNPSLLKLVRDSGLSIVAVSGFEIRLALDLGFPGNRIYFNGNGKQPWEMRLAIANGCIMNVDSVFNAEQLVSLVSAVEHSLTNRLEVTIRLNVDLETEVHPYLQTVSQNSKFGVNFFAQTLGILLPHQDKIKITGLHCHLGSTIEDVSIYTMLFQRLDQVIEEYKESLCEVEVVNIGGGLGINYYHEESKDTPTIADLSNAVPTDTRFTIMVEPGRSLVGNTGILITKVLGVKSTNVKTFVVVDGSMTELIRPALYQAFHNIIPIKKHKGGAKEHETVDFVGPVCESGDFLGKDRSIPYPLPKEGDLYAVLDAGAYCMAMASNYNMRARPAEILINGDSFEVIQERETYEQITRGMKLANNDIEGK